MTSRPPEFDDHVVAFIPFLKNLAKKLERDPQKRDDLVQDTLTRALDGQGSYRAGGGWTAWLSFQMRAVLSGWRLKRIPEVEDPNSKYASHEAIDPKPDDVVFLHEVIQAVPDRYREDVVLRAMGADFREIGQRRGVSVEAARKTTIKAIKKAKKDLSVE